MELWLVSIPVEGHPLPEKEYDYIQYEKVVFHQYNDPYPEYGKRLVASIIMQGQLYGIVDKAIELIEDAITKLTFTSSLALKLNDSDYYLTPQKESTISGIPKIEGEGFKHRISKHTAFWYNIGEDGTKSILSKIEHLKPENQEIFNNSLKHYRIAVGSLNPFQSIEAYFACISVMTKELLGIQKKVKKHHLRQAVKDAIAPVSKDFYIKFDKYFDEDRTTAAHGYLDILDPIKMKETQAHAFNLQQWVRKLLLDYLNKNQLNIK